MPENEFRLVGDLWLKGFPGGITVLVGKGIAGHFCLWYCNYLVFFTGFAVAVVMAFGVLLLSFLLLRFFCVALV